LVETANVPVPPAAEKEVGVAAAVTAHFAVEADVTLWLEELHAPAPTAATYTQHENTTPRIFSL
jgi:hypothetical protein